MLTKMSYKLLYCAILISGLIVIRIHDLSYRYNRYKEYLRMFNKSYTYEELQKRLVYFEESLEEIERLNHGKNKTGAVHGLTKFSDWSRDESRNLLSKRPEYNCRDQYFSCYKKDVFDKVSFYFGESFSENRLRVPKSLDWRKKEGVIGPVENQKQCSGCWAFSIVGLMEAMAAIDRIGHDELSVQQLLDCSTYLNGCNGGNIDAALTVMCTYNQSLTTEEQYPLKLVTEPCHRQPYGGVRGIKNYEIMCDIADKDLMAKLVHGPVMAVVHPTGWLNYNSGIISRNCFDDAVGMVHVVQVIGFDTTTDEVGEEIPYYIVKNSWGSDWGENGYIRIARGNNLCGLNDHVVSLDVK